MSFKPSSTVGLITDEAGFYKARTHTIGAQGVQGLGIPYFICEYNLLLSFTPAWIYEGSMSSFMRASYLSETAGRELGWL